MIEQAEKRLIDGHYAKSENVVAFCHVLTHRGYLSKTLVKSHDCLAKKCPFFKPIRPDYWKAVESAEQKKKKNRLKRKQSVETISERDAFIRETLEESGHIYVTSIKEEPRVFMISYIYDQKTDLTTEIQSLREKLKKPIKLTAKIGSDGAIEQLIRKRRRENGKTTDLRKAPKVGAAAKKRLAALGVYSLEDLFGRSGDELYELDCELSGDKVNRRYLAAYRSAVEFVIAMYA